MLIVFFLQWPFYCDFMSRTQNHTSEKKRYYLSNEFQNLIYAADNHNY